MGLHAAPHNTMQVLHHCQTLVADALLQMLDADDAVLEQAMQTGAALRRARDLQKAARKPKVTPA